MMIKHFLNHNDEVIILIQVQSKFARRLGIFILPSFWIFHSFFNVMLHTYIFVSEIYGTILSVWETFHLVPSMNSAVLRKCESLLAGLI